VLQAAREGSRMGAPPRPAPPRGGAARVRGRGRSFARAVGCSGARSGWFDMTCSYLDEHCSELRERVERRGGRRRVLARLARPLRALLLQRARHLVEIARDRGAHARGRGLAPERERARGGLERGRGGPSAAGGGRRGRGARPPPPPLGGRARERGRRPSRGGRRGAHHDRVRGAASARASKRAARTRATTLFAF